MRNRTCTILIPVRMGSSRLPNKPLKDIAGKPLLKWVIELAQKINFKASIIVLTEDKIIKEAKKTKWNITSISLGKPKKKRFQLL